MIYIVIGQSGAGKTTFCKEHLLKGPYEIREDIVPVTTGEGGTVGIGKYGIERRCEGTDTLPYNAQEKIVQETAKLAAEGKDIVLEGDRITSGGVMEALKRIKEEKKLYLITCSVSTSMRRLREAGSGITAAFVKGTKTKARRIYLDYGREFRGEVVSTEER